MDQKTCVICGYPSRGKVAESGGWISEIITFNFQEETVPISITVKQIEGRWKFDGRKVLPKEFFLKKVFCQSKPSPPPVS